MEDIFIPFFTFHHRSIPEEDNAMEAFLHGRDNRRGMKISSMTHAVTLGLFTLLLIYINSYYYAVALIHHIPSPVGDCIPVHEGDIKENR